MDLMGSWRTASAAEATSHWLEHTKGPLDSLYYTERWCWSGLVVQELRAAHAEFRGWPLTKHALLADLLKENQQFVLDGSFPEADDIKRAFQPAAIITLRDRSGELYVTDGLERTFMSLWNGIDRIDGYIFDEGSERFVAKHNKGP